MNHVHVVQVKNTSSVMVNSPKHIQVAVGVITQNKRFFVCRRLAHQHQGNKWEFPGGKVDGDETAQQALSRELFEEIGIQAIECEALTTINFSYPDKKVSLHVHIVSNFTGQPYGAEGQEAMWVSFDELTKLDFPAANVGIIDVLRARNK
jgi:8-oxo-dGTP diphosphatase